MRTALRDAEAERICCDGGDGLAGSWAGEWERRHLLRDGARARHLRFLILALQAEAIRWDRILRLALAAVRRLRAPALVLPGRARCDAAVL